MGKRILSIFFACIEALATVAAVVVFVFSITDFLDYCEIGPSIMPYHGQTSFDHTIVDKDGKEYPAGTVFDVTYLFSDGRMHIDCNSQTVNVIEYDNNYYISDASNSDELYEALKQLKAEEKQAIAKELALPAVIILVVFFALFAFFLFINNKIKSIFWKIIALIAISTNGIILAMFVGSYYSNAKAPIIYLYPEEETVVNVSLDLDGNLTSSYPRYDEDLGWTVTASPDGTLTDGDGREYEYLFWEGDLRIKPDLSRGFCVKGEDTVAFLEDALAQLGLTDKEADTFIMFWLPQLESNKYNVITFQTEAYEDVASLEITPAPDTVIRVNMLWYPVNSYVDMEAQDLEALNPDTREGFTVVEWGGEKYERGVLGLLAR